MARHDAEMLELVVEGNPQRPTVRLRGEVDLSNAPRLLHALVSVAYHAPRGIVVDLAETTFLGCRGTAVLIIVRRIQQTQGRSFEIRGARGGVRKVLGWVGLDDVEGHVWCATSRRTPRPSRCRPPRRASCTATRTAGTS
jgi:anti-anti-sigma factor